MYKALKKKRRVTPLLEQNELKKLFLRYLMRRAFEFQVGEEQTNSLLLQEILQERYNNRSRFSSLSRNINICPFTGRTRGYYNFAKVSRMQFKFLAGAGVLPGFRKACW